jgi:hypothetical protein
LLSAGLSLTVITAARGRLSWRGSIIFTWVQSAAALSGGGWFVRRLGAGLSIGSFVLLARPPVHPTAGRRRLTVRRALDVDLTGEVHRCDSPHIDASSRLNTSLSLELNQCLPRARAENAISLAL